MRSERFTTTGLGGVVLRTRRGGDPSLPTVVLLHGGGANAHWWDFVVPGLVRDLHVAALDFRGHGESDFPEELLPGAFEHDLAALLEHLGAPDAALVGHSMGARVALAHAARDPRPRALVLLEAARGGDRRERRRMRLALAARRTYASREEAVDRFRFLPPSTHAEERVRRHVAEHSVREENGRFGFAFDPRWFQVPPTTPPDPARVEAPTLVVRGAESTLLSARGAAELAAEIPGARVTEVAGAGHNVHVEQPAALLDRLRDFLLDESD